MAGDADRVDTNDQAFTLTHELAATLMTAGVIVRCLDCDPSGHDYHLDPDHTADELLAAGAERWSSIGPVSKVSVVRTPIFLGHHESGGSGR